MLNVLCLASWYPNKTNPFAGDFIQRHAEATALFTKVVVLFVVKDENLEAGKIVIERSFEKNLIVYRAYYGKSSNFNLLEKLLSFRTYFNLQKRLYKQVEKEQGSPDIVHLHVAMKAGMLAKYLKKKFKIPYVVTENWTGYYKQDRLNIYSQNPILKKLNKKVLDEADLFLPVTKNLGMTINADFTPIKYSVIPNVVNTTLFSFTPYEPAIFRFIHPSTMNYQKKSPGILAACEIVKAKGYNFELIMLGKIEEKLIDLAKQLHLYNSTVFFKPAIPYTEVAKEMQQASCLLLFSRFENLPCVILEALCTGLPVISSKVGGIDEIIDDSNGILVESEHIIQLADAMCKMIDTYADYNRTLIAKSATQKFNYNTVGKQYLDEYKKVLNITA